MKRKLFIQAIIISLLLLVLIGIVVCWNFVSWNKSMNDLSRVPPRRYMDLSSWHTVNNYEYNFFNVTLGQFDHIFMKVVCLLVILQSFFLTQRLKIRNAFLISGLILSSLVGGIFIFFVNTFQRYLVTGLNPYFMYVPVFFLVLQLVIWVYLNMLLFKKLAEKSLER
jgi:uncharacterized membrane protein